MTPLIQSVRFLPLFVVQVLGALNDNIFKNALLILMTFSLLKGVDEGSLSLMTTLGAFLFIVPFFLFIYLFSKYNKPYNLWETIARLPIKNQVSTKPHD